MGNDLKKLMEGQLEIDKEIYDLAEKEGLSSKDLLPIVDGVCDITQFLNNEYKVMWILKEPYDDWDEDEDGTLKPYGGGWSLVKDGFCSPNVLKVKSWQPIIYSMYGLFNGLHYNKMDWIRDDPEMADVLKRIAYINVSKMPALTNSENGIIKNLYTKWKQILFRQIELYSSEFIIFGGTYQFFADDMNDKGAVLIHQVFCEEDNYINVYKLGNTYLLSVYHPAAFKKRLYYVDSIIDIIISLKA